MHTSFHTKPLHPQAQSAHTLGLFSLICFGLTFICGCFSGIPGIILGFIAVAKAKKVKTDFQASPGMYHVDSLQKADSGRIMGLISALTGLVFSTLWIVLVFFLFVMSYLGKQ